MKLEEFSFDLPDELIAQHPPKNRSDSRLLLFNKQTKQIKDSHFSHFIDQIKAGDLLVFNDTKVIPARLFGKKTSGGKIEVLIERVISTHQVLAKIRASKSPKAGSYIHLGIDHQLLEPIDVQVNNRQGELFELTFPSHSTVYEFLALYGHIPLPPYVQRDDEELDVERYQTVYAKHQGAAAAPTAGLHFDQKILQQLSAKGVNFAYVTLHVGAGTYQPVRVDQIEDHQMHSEYIVVDKKTIAQIKQTKKNGKRVIAIGTTSLRSLESAALFAEKQKTPLSAYQGDTDIFIYPGYQFKLVDALLTNFHLSQSTLFMLVSAFSSLDSMQDAYAHAIKQKYRFFSYGDAMLLA